jgi:hypothetical protein
MACSEDIRDFSASMELAMGFFPLAANWNRLAAKVFLPHMLALGQYLHPSLKRMAVVRYLPVEEFQRLGKLARRMGFTQVAAGGRRALRAIELSRGRWRSLCPRPRVPFCSR